MFQQGFHLIRRLPGRPKVYSLGYQPLFAVRVVDHLVGTADERIYPEYDTTSYHNIGY